MEGAENPSNALRPPQPASGRHPILGIDTMRPLLLLSAFFLHSPHTAAAGDSPDGTARAQSESLLNAGANS